MAVVAGLYATTTLLIIGIFFLTGKILGGADGFWRGAAELAREITYPTLVFGAVTATLTVDSGPCSRA